MRTRIIALVSALAAAGAVLHGTTAEAATPPVRFIKIAYNPAGSDTGTNAHLNAEWVQIKNFSATTRTLTGWTIRDNNGYVYKFPTFTIKPGAVVTVHTGKGTNTALHRYYQRTWYVWNNSGDKAQLRTPAGVVSDACAYAGGAASVGC